MSSSNTDRPAVARSRVEGAFTALAAGDALGWPQEFLSRKQKVQPTPAFRDWQRRSGGRFQPHTEIIRAGEYSDDTQLTLAVARSRLTAGTAWWAHFTRNELPLWMLYERGGGGATKRAASSWLRGVAPWKQSEGSAVARYFEAGGNGVAMRVIPHAIFHAEAEDPSALLKDAMKPALTVQQVAEILSVNERTVYRMVTKGELPGFRVAGSWRFLREESWVAEQKAAVRSGNPEEDKEGA